MQVKNTGQFQPTTKGHVRHKRLLAAKGWSRRAAAPLLGVHVSHLDLVLNGHRTSRRLLDRIEALHPRQS
jgi:plasmid maintenance system antidote protein VapI